MEIGDDDQIALTLMYTLNHSLVKPYLNRIVRSYYSEEVAVGLHTARSMESFVRRITEGKTTGGRSKDCRSLLVMIGMCLSNRLNETTGVTKEVIYCTIFPSMTRGSAQRILSDGKKKLDRLVGKDVRDFSAVDRDAKR